MCCSGLHRLGGGLWRREVSLAGDCGPGRRGSAPSEVLAQMAG